ncbi:MAG: hypothetical protein LBO66_12655 [Deltaproteobacteria bacterium]|jgi:hypothetical protein|nr:hypothetical protein [Deltaproteobacteria bacterium]
MRVKALAESRSAPREYLERVGKRLASFTERVKAKARADGLRSLRENVAALSQDPRFQKLGDGEIAKAAYWRGALASVKATLGEPFDPTAFDEKLADRANLAQIPDVELPEMEIPRERARSRDEPSPSPKF